MASLKDMRVRIASTKATQKITKAMQMVAASKLRRAQTAAEAARPYAEKMDTVIASIAGATTAGSGPALLVGTGKDQVHLLLVCTGERGLCGAFNSSIVRLARERALALMNQGKTVKFFCVGRKGYEQLRRNFDKQIVGHLELRSVRQLGFVNANDIAKKVLELFNTGEFDVCTLFYSRFKSVIAQIPTAQQIIPWWSRRLKPMPAQRRATTTSPPKMRSSTACCRAILRCRSSALCSRTTLRSTARR
jgi:F-type H+-transporting ATPase subunit gamma